MSQAGSNSSISNPALATAYVTDAGTAVPAGNVLNVLGGTNANTSGVGNTIIINATPGAPNRVITDFDDFIGDVRIGGKLGWDVQGCFSVNGTAAHPGLVSPNSVDDFSLGMFGSADSAPFIVGGGALSINWVHNLVALSDAINTYTIYLGLIDAVSTDAVIPPTSGIYFTYTNSVNAGKWQIETNNSGVKTTNNTNTAASIGFHNYGITVNATGTSVAFTIDGVVVANSPIATNIPLTALSPSIICLKSAGNMPAQLIDLFYYTQTLTVAR